MNFVPMRIKLVIIAFFASSLSVFAQQPPPPPTPPPGFPIDGGLIVLMVFALLLGLYKINKYKKRVTI